MRTLFTLTIVLAGLLLAPGCRKTEITDVDCEKIRTGIVTNNTEMVGAEINRITTSFRRNPTSQDSYGHEQNINKLVQMLIEDCGFQAELICYGCIYTDPPQSEISITVSNGATTVKKIIDLSFDRRDRLIFQNMHN